MNLDAIPVGSTVLLDANIPIYAHAGKSGECGRLLERCARGEMRGVLPAHTLAEVCHRLMALEAGALTGSEAPRRHYIVLNKPERVRNLVNYARAARELLASGLMIEALKPEDFLPALEYQGRWGLLTNDSLLLAVGMRLSLDILASADKGLHSVPHWKVYTPSDLQG